MTPAERRAAIFKLKDDRQAQVAQAAAVGPSCLFCIHGPEKSARGVCEHPVFWEWKTDPVGGNGGAKSLMSTIKARSEDGLCGPEAQLFEARNVFARVWRALRYRPPGVSSPNRI